jgi:hypothetical protein
VRTVNSTFFRWTRSSPRTGGVLYAGIEYTSVPQAENARQGDATV